VSSDHDLERLLREGWTNVPEPEATTTRRARERAIAAVRRRPRRRVRIAALVGTALVVAIALGVGIGSLVAPSGTASSGPIGFGLLPEAGWYALQSATPRAPGQPRVAMAANVPFDEEDMVNGLAEPSALPYTTLLGLPLRGVILIVTFTEPDPWVKSTPSPRYPTRTLPLRLSEATPYIEYGTQIRPEQPLGQYQLRATVDGKLIDVNVYFGTPTPSSALRAEAQRQLDGLVVHSGAPTETDAVVRPASPATPSAPAVIDRTLRCTTSPSGGIWEIEARANAGIRQGSGWKQVPYAVSSSGNVGSTLDPLGDALAWVTAGRPSRDTTADWGFRAAQVSRWGTLAVNRRVCRSARARVTLGHSGLEGSSASPFGDKLDCAAPRRVLVRVRAIATTKTDLRARGDFQNTHVPLKSAQLAVTTEKGKPIMYADVADSGRTRLFTAKGCVFD
jgi:hypothetical protein